MRLDASECRRRLADESFGVLSTVDPDYGTHLVPVVYAVSGDHLAIPIDTVKPKASTRLRRISNLEADNRAMLLVHHYSHDWDELWWLHAGLTFLREDDPAPWAVQLTEKYSQLANAGSIASVILFRIVRLTGWTSSGDEQDT